MPLLKAGPGQIPDRHEGRCSCLSCNASRHLTEGDREIMEFFGIVQDQTVNSTQGDGPCILSPRLEGWVAACELYGVPSESRPRLVDMARTLFSGVYGHVSVHGLHRMDELSLASPKPDELEDAVNV